MSLAKEMRLELGRAKTCTNTSETLEILKDFAVTSSIEFYQGVFREQLETTLPGFVEVLKRSKNINRVDVKVNPVYELSRDFLCKVLSSFANDHGYPELGTNEGTFRTCFEHLMPILQIETVKYVKFEFENTPFNLKDGEWSSAHAYVCSLDLDFMENCLSAEKMGQVDKVEIVLKRSLEVSYDRWCECHEKVFKYENLNATNLIDFVRKLLGKQSMRTG